jgi:uncharacterized protein with PIN domain
VAVRLFCDEMLERLGRWLRAAGHDTVIAEGTADRQIIACCLAERRHLLTRDRELARLAGRNGVDRLLLVGPSIDADAQVLRDKLALDWLAAPFTRCLRDNTPLAAAAPEDAARVPERARALAGLLLRCPRCNRLYWPGSHVRRMQARLAAWAA